MPASKILFLPIFAIFQRISVGMASVLKLLASLPFRAIAVKYDAPDFNPVGGIASEAVAQLVEQQTFNLWVLGSIPSGLIFPAECNVAQFRSFSCEICGFLALPVFSSDAGKCEFRRPKARSMVLPLVRQRPVLAVWPLGSMAAFPVAFGCALSNRGSRAMASNVGSCVTSV